MSKLTREQIIEILASPPKNGKFHDFSAMGFYNLNLSGLNLTNADLYLANFYISNLTNANLSNANLSNANLQRIKLSNANLTNADLTHANLSNTDLTNANLSNANLQHANLSNTDLTDADLTDADLRFNLNNNSVLLGTTIRGFHYPLFFHPKSDLISIGCKTYPFENWMEFSDKKIDGMGQHALYFWKENKEKIMALFEALKTT